MPISESAVTELAQLLGRGIVGELIPDLVRQGPQGLIEAEAAAALYADSHQGTAERRGHLSGSSDRLLGTPVGVIQLRYRPHHQSTVQRRIRDWRMARV